ncbi:MAG: macrolide ABC transporter ATP-binding protein [Elusimicrobia bacterium GWD2_63_28]|nr:MAG: macrolide ABC transporter ATP-binding protein [Elusimicrobia bacterium GWD2_63_28]
MDKELVIEAKGVSKTYAEGEVKVHALHPVDLAIRRGEFTAVAGPSGSGKTTLLNIISGLDTPSGGRIKLAGREMSSMTQGELSDFRRDHIGFIFQAYNLIPVLTVGENIEYVLLLRGVSPGERSARVNRILDEVGLAGKRGRFPAQLSGGQQQRVAIARAMVSGPDIILADEPTANLDSATGSALMDMMRELNEGKGMTFLFSTHDRMIMEKSSRLVTLKDGRVESDSLKK